MNNLKPFIKWVGGKTQLLPDIINNLPNDKSEITTYIEPFIGGGSVLLNILDYFPNLNKVIINDFNPILIQTYLEIKNNPKKLMTYLDNLQDIYYKTEDKQNLYYKIRNKFNNSTNLSEKAYLFIFLNKTCFNGLYRENKSGYFNVPFNNAKHPSFYDKENILNISKYLNKYNVQCYNSSYENMQKYVTINNTFVYLDPPYRPITKSSAFTAYTKSGFNDDSQKQLKLFCDKIDEKNSFFMLSNSDPKNTDVTDSFFDDLYEDYIILRVKAKRNINSDGEGRGKINEILVKNYE